MYLSMPKGVYCKDARAEANKESQMGSRDDGNIEIPTPSCCAKQWYPPAPPPTINEKNAARLPLERRDMDHV
ncbi:hypothetical protein SAMD00023353_6100370 [Rosellinia necatrix]|uniref:Uncharacterized protein n=1 Tax=Rosellinia necatrix TaxID=77044 RepID=A0A1S8AA73_ROSNE|nr:hypothetical protein SAMD00023353_6100370 [Rosellinia necatrix]